MNPLRTTARHEAAHALLCFIFDRRLDYAEIEDDGNGEIGCDELLPEHRSSYSQARWREKVEEYICVALAGPLSGTVADSGGSKAWRESVANDVQTAHTWIRRLTRQFNLTGIDLLHALRDRTNSLLNDQRAQDAIEEIANALQRKRKLSGREVEDICARCGVQQLKTKKKEQ